MLWTRCGSFSDFSGTARRLKCWCSTSRRCRPRLHTYGKCSCIPSTLYNALIKRMREQRVTSIEVKLQHLCLLRLFCCFSLSASRTHPFYFIMRFPKNPLQKLIDSLPLFIFAVYRAICAWSRITWGGNESSAKKKNKTHERCVKSRIEDEQGWERTRGRMSGNSEVATIFELFIGLVNTTPFFSRSPPTFIREWNRIGLLVSRREHYDSVPNNRTIRSLPSLLLLSLALSLSLTRMFRGREMWISLENYPLLVPLYERSSARVRTGHDVTVEKALWITSHPLFDSSSLATRNWETDISVEKRWTFTAHLRLTTWRIWRA